MSRHHYWQFIINKEGQPIPDVNISIYLAGTNTPANVYLDEFGSNYTDQTPQIITNNMGYFEFWIGDNFETYGYSKTQKFKLEWEKVGVSLGKIDYIDIFPPLYEVDETNYFSITKDKVISDRLAYLWEEHRLWDVTDIVNYGFPIHGLEPINELDNSADDFPNKTLSNFLGKKWNDHVEYTFSTVPASASSTPHDIKPIDTTLIDTLKNKLINNNLAHFWEENRTWDVTTDGLPFHGIDAIDITLTDTTINKLINNNLAHFWEENRTWDVTTDGLPFHGIDAIDITLTDTTINKLINNNLAHFWEENRTWNVTTNGLPFHGIDAVDSTLTDNIFNKLVSNKIIHDSATIDYVNNLLTGYTVSILTWTLESDGSYSKVINHNLNSEYPSIEIWNTSKIKEKPLKIQIIDNNSFKIYVISNYELLIKVRI